jgi:hypothetical protein
MKQGEFGGKIKGGGVLYQRNRGELGKIMKRDVMVFQWNR